MLQVKHGLLVPFILAYDNKIFEDNLRTIEKYSKQDKLSRKIYFLLLL